MEVMEDGNLMDKVNILIQRDMEYYKNKQSILQETICPGVIGGKLDFPRSASFASVKLVLWWEEEFRAAHKKPSGFLHCAKEEGIKESSISTGDCGGIVKDSDPSKFVSLISKSADQLLAHLHILTQEALDHADLSVLTGTIGAAALLKNCLWFYIHIMKETDDERVEQLRIGYKKYNEMCEALAERLLDLHCRLIALYILQDADCLHWESEKPFFESERGSYTIQMWWLYMKGTREDLWNTVPPKMAQRVFSGMLNESLTILTVRYCQTVPSEARSQLLLVDISNLLLCIAQLLPSVCSSAKELIGFSYNNSKILRDIHTKCQELLNCLLMRGSSLDDLHKVFRKGLDNVELFKSRSPGVVPWVIFAMPNIFRVHPKPFSKMDDLDPDIWIALELMVLLAQPQANWALLLKVLCMKRCRIISIILSAIFDEHSKGVQKPGSKDSECGAFLCNGDGSCKDVITTSATYNTSHYYDIILSGTEIIIFVGNDKDLSEALLPLIIRQPNWSSCFERRHVWNQIRPPWYEAILNFVQPLLPITSDTVVNAVQTGATMYQAMSLILACFSHFWDSVHPCLPYIANLLQEHVQSDIVPVNGSCLIQILVCALYSDLLKRSEQPKKEVRFVEQAPTSSNKADLTTFDASNSGPEAIALATAEALCSIDEDDKHTDQFEEFLEQVRSTCEFDERGRGSERAETNQQMIEALASDVLMTTSGKRSLKTLHHYLKCNSEWLYQQLGVSESKDKATPDRAIQPPLSLLHTMFNIGHRPFDQLLSGEWCPNWMNFLQTPMGMSCERIWKQISLRWEFRNSNATSLTSQQSQIVNNITTLLKQ